MRFNTLSQNYRPLNSDIKVSNDFGFVFLTVCCPKYKSVTMWLIAIPSDIPGSEAWQWISHNFGTRNCMGQNMAAFLKTKAQLFKSYDIGWAVRSNVLVSGHSINPLHVISNDTLPGITYIAILSSVKSTMCFLALNWLTLILFLFRWRLQ